ncbi:mesoderm posterior aa [Phyllopteryx taeniolatus]|uniref:mesoderm posterior aa n=1 Tax=Phyllopteryx taeniolatus TaxID=161469 RepID=UPI002AD2BB20|nr:mesoderm posterior aa [Phyllopteryx taeniolatus]
MEARFQLHENQGTFSLECLLEKSYPVYDVASDPGYFSASLSPTSSEDSFSPNLADALDCFLFSSPSPAPIKKTRSRYPGKKRQTASEREKLRMRDLTKALHHLRSYLPPSLAPSGQTLTKIETLRLAVRYISFLSAQLGLSEEALEQRRRPSGQAEPPQTLSQFLGHQDGSCEQTTTAHVLAPQTGCQFPSDVSFDAQQYWLLQQQLHNFSGQC